MGYYLDLFSPETFETFSAGDRSVSGFRTSRQRAASRIHPRDKLVCYLTKLSRWVGVLEVLSDSFVSSDPLFYPSGDPYVVRFRVLPLVWLSRDHSVPIRESAVWDILSFTRDHDKASSSWTGKFRQSLVQLDDRDGTFLEDLLVHQDRDPVAYPVDEAEYRRLVAQPVRRAEGIVTVTVPEESPTEEEKPRDKEAIRQSAHVQGMLARIGEAMGFTVWLPRNDRARALKEWTPAAKVLLESLPLNYDDVTLRTIEQIDVLWLNKRSIARAFEVEHTTAVYSGLLRMADLLALQPNMDIKLHIVAPADRREKVFQELRRPVFSLLDRGPLSELCSYLSYDSVEEIASLEHLAHTTDTVLQDFIETVD